MVYIILILLGVLNIVLFIRNRSFVVRIVELKNWVNKILSGSSLELPPDPHHDDLAELRQSFVTMYTRMEESRRDMEMNYQKLQLSSLTLEEKYAQAYTLQLIQEEIARELDSNQLMKKTLDILLGVFGSKWCTIYMVNEQKSVLELKANSGFAAAPVYDKIIPVDADHLVARACRERMVFTDADEAMAQGKTSGNIAIPLSGRHNCLGVMVMENELVRIINQDLIDFAKLIAQELSLSLENAYLYDKMRRMATHDALTGVYNRMYLMNYISELFASRPQIVSVIIFDLDHFKAINDRYGHLVGDMVLKETAQLASEMLPTGILARYGGEEFVVVLPEVSADEAFDFAEKLRYAVFEHPYQTDDGRWIVVTLSGGLAGYPESSDSFEGLLQKADEALYNAKNSGRNRICRAEKTAKG